MAQHPHSKRHLPEDEAARRRWQHPESILEGVGLKPGSTFIDVGCGEGFFALPAARMVGPHGRVCGIDIDAEALDLLQEKAFREGFDNVVLHKGMAEEIVLCKGCADIVFFGIDLHDFVDPVQVLRNANRMVSGSGVIVDVDWKKEPLPLGPPTAKKFSLEYAAALMVEAGLRVTAVAESGPYHYTVTAVPEDKKGELGVTSGIQCRRS
ncbi:class I SAM-dependent methyltransferase [Methanoculleus sp. FWC-SCC3]|uniref:Class I SAM-dependent methyltransferase n=1 Tax=Methanoculleus methanifontis TaxID=2584086 RepID=A0ABT8M3N6_9EURY|nr:class I SAM-dependent methyltransferase [Methanoculleus sp. FWC-SCC3]MDN7012603.1 class I SAM-dependent methyltransferase [Methanoculleus sp. FWC-SCC3]